MTSTDLDLDAIEARASAATPGPWLTMDEAPTWDHPRVCGYDQKENHRTEPYFATGPRVADVEQAEVDEAFIAAARTEIPALVAEVRRLRAAVLAEREAWQKALGDIVERHEAIAEKESLAATVSLSSSGLSGRAVGRRAVVADIDTAIRARGEG